MAKTTPISEQTSSKAINARITNIQKSAARINVAIHETGLLILEHTRAFNDCTGAARLVNAMPKSHRRALVVNWFAKFSPIVVEVKAGVASAHLAKEGSKKCIKFNIDGARQMPFYELAEVENEPGFFLAEDAVEAVDKLAKRLARLSKGEGKTPVREQDKVFIATVAAMLNSLKLPEIPTAGAANTTTEQPELPVAQAA